MSSATTTTRSRSTLIGVALTAALAVGAAVVASEGSRDVTPAQQTASSRSASGDCPAIGTLVAAAATAGSPAAVSTTRSQARSLATSTASDDVRELAQNLADDLAAYKVSLTTTSSQTSQRQVDIKAALHSDLAALRHVCGH